MERQTLDSVIEPAAILVVEDEPHSRQGLGALLVERGYRVETAADVPEAIRHLKASRFSGAIIDIRLPDVHEISMTGWDVAEICRTFTPEMGLLFVSAQGGPEMEARAGSLGRAAFLEKPIDSARLSATLGRLGLC
jgi:two-component system, NtrC family, response regulator